MLKISSLEKLVIELGRLPGIGPKTAQRLAYSILTNAELSHGLEQSLVLVRETVKQCSECFSFTDSAEEPALCHFCTDPTRKDELVCVVEEPADIARIESSGAFKGRYHVLHGAISPLDRIGPDDLKIAELLNRIPKQGIKEVILALDPDLEGDTTALYLAKVLNDLGVKVTRIASGVPLGSDIDYVDDRTLGRALENRVEL